MSKKRIGLWLTACLVCVVLLLSCSPAARQADAADTDYSSLTDILDELNNISIEVANVNALSFNQKVRVYWDELNGAEGYDIKAVYPDGTEYKTASTANTYCNFVNLTNGTEYSFQVRAYITSTTKLEFEGVADVIASLEEQYGVEFIETADGYKVCGPYSAVVKGTPYDDTIHNLTAAPYNQKIKLAWEGADAVDGYYIYAMYSDGSLYKTYATTKTTCNFTKLVNGDSYQFKVRSYKIDANGSRVYGAYSDVVTATPLMDSVKNLEGLAFNKKVYVNWDALSGAAKYHINVTYADGSLYKTYDTSKTTCNFTNLTNGKAYTFKVCACYANSKGTACYGNYSTAVTVTPYNDTVANLKAASSDSKIKLSWTAVDAADGYYIYAMYSDGSLYKTYATTKTTCNFTKLTNGQTYKFKVRAYKLSQTGTKVYSTYSATVNAKPHK